MPTSGHGGYRYIVSAKGAEEVQSFLPEPSNTVMAKDAISHEPKGEWTFMRYRVISLESRRFPSSSVTRPSATFIQAGLSLPVDPRRDHRSTTRSYRRHLPSDAVHAYHGNDEA